MTKHNRPTPQTNNAALRSTQRESQNAPLVLVLALVFATGIIPIEGFISDVAWFFQELIGGDLRRTLLTLQQFGDFATMALIICVIALLDRERLRRTLDWLFAAGVGILMFNAMKLATGRLRPDLKLMVDSESVIAAPVPTDFFAWTSAYAQATGRSFAFPSTHTTHAFIAAVFLCAMYPKLRPLVFALAALVACCRVLFGAHWLSDVIAGAALGSVWAYLCTKHYLGVRLVDLVWKLIVNRNAAPAYPQVREREEAAMRTRV